MSNRHWTFRLISVGLLTAITLVFFWRITFSGMILARGDVYSYFYPLWDARSASFRAGQLPLWSPDIFMGVPLLGNSQLGTFYPPNWLVTPFDAPSAITLSLLAHTIWAMLGMVLLLRRSLQVERIPALLAGVVFGLGGYLGGQSEHINQLQALSWMPWLFWLIQPPASGQHSLRLKTVLTFAACLALQLLAGHPQTVFITLVGLGVFGLAQAFHRQPVTGKRFPFSLDGRRLLRLGLLLAVGGALALVLAAPQLIPSLELSQLGNRGGGLDPQKVLAFSFTPLLLGRGLLPSYDGLLFGEYIAYSGVIGLSLAIIGLFASRRARPFLLLVIVGVVLALGAYNPLNWLLASLPGFSFFRVPARWMALEALGVAALAAAGLQSILDAPPPKRALALIGLVIGGLALASSLAAQQAIDVTGPAVPTIRTWAGWGLALVSLGLLISLRRRLGARWTTAGLAGAALLELFFASQIMPYNLTAPHDVYSASRFTIRQLQAYNVDQVPAGRMLSISPLEFDPGDKDALNARYAKLGMDALSTRIALVATKLREVVGPNLGLQWGIPSIDGFDGGLLPTRYYSAFSELLLPAGSDPSTDGRLREMLALPACNGACIPDQRWLNLTNTRYLITDKTADVVQDGIFYDTSLSLSRQANQPVVIDPVPAFAANAIDLLCASPTCAVRVSFTYADGSRDLLRQSATFAVQPYTAVRFQSDAARIPVRVELVPADSLTLKAVTLVDTRVNGFQQVALPPFTRVLSSDIKVYENLAVQPRAFLVYQADTVEANTAALLDRMRAANFDPRQQAVVVGGTALESGGGGTATITRYTAEGVEVQVKTDAPAYLILTDAYYPGWVAAVNGTAAPILRADVMFRAVAIPAGESTVVFAYQPWWWPVVIIVGGLGWLGVGVLAWLRHSSR